MIQNDVLAKFKEIFTLILAKHALQSLKQL